MQVDTKKVHCGSGFVVDDLLVVAKERSEKTDNGKAKPVEHDIREKEIVK